MIGDDKPRCSPRTWSRGKRLTAGASTALAVAGLLATAGSASGQTCAWMPMPIAQEAVRALPQGTVAQYYCAPCKDRIARKIVVDETEIRPLDTYNNQVLINAAAVDIAYLYVLDPRRRRWTNLGLLIRCHEEDDVPPTLPANRAAE